MANLALTAVSYTVHWIAVSDADDGEVAQTYLYTVMVSQSAKPIASDSQRYASQFDFCPVSTLPPTYAGLSEIYDKATVGKMCNTLPGESYYNRRSGLRF